MDGEIIHGNCGNSRDFDMIERAEYRMAYYEVSYVLFSELYSAMYYRKAREIDTECHHNGSSLSHFFDSNDLVPIWCVTGYRLECSI